MQELLQRLVDSAALPLLKPWMDPIHAFLNGLPPWSWRLAVCAYLAIGGLWAAFLKREAVFRGAPSQARWRDLRLWLPLILLPYLLLYLLL
ncbi:MAG: hypothetical protein J7M29_07370 [Verrucomicrobia bacterium]|nr:hypothetical protein [Verrucomicrobiota bacterium]